MQIKRKLALCGTGMVLAAVLVGCTTTSNDSRSEGRTIDDKNITAKVKDALQREPVYKFEGVDVTTFAGIVQLSGFVDIPAQRERAQQLAALQPGVSQVINGIALKPAMLPTGHPAPSTDAAPRVYTSPANQNPEPNPNSQPK